ncbi:MAG: hypothetical protein ABSG07_21305 [Terriglobales bacterium]|jgi:hypothetical protein
MLEKLQRIQEDRGKRLQAGMVDLVKEIAGLNARLDGMSSNMGERLNKLEGALQTLASCICDLTATMNATDKLIKV